MNDSYNGEPSFSLGDFKKWMASQSKPTPKARGHAELVGMHVESKISIKRLMTKMTADEGDLTELANDFRQNGGTIVDSDKDDNVLIEVDAGSFTIPKFFVKKSS